MPGRRHHRSHKHKHDNKYKPIKEQRSPGSLDMMSGDSSNVARDLKLEAPNLTLPSGGTTSGCNNALITNNVGQNNKQDKGVQSGDVAAAATAAQSGETVEATVLVEQRPRSNSNAVKEAVPSIVVTNTGRDIADDDTIEMIDGAHKDVDNNEKPIDKQNGNCDQLDAVWTKQSEKKKEEENEECAVKCLYYTMQCCECTIQ